MEMAMARAKDPAWAPPLPACRLHVVGSAMARTVRISRTARHGRWYAIQGAMRGTADTKEMQHPVRSVRNAKSFAAGYRIHA